MPKKKKSSTFNLSSFTDSSILPISKSYMSLLYGVLTVVVLFVIIFLALRAISQREGDVTNEAQNTEQSQTYEVKEGDNLWTIAEDQLKDGYQWTRIAEVNKISNPNLIVKGTKLTIPEVKASTPSALAPSASPTPAASAADKITGASYTIREGDNLWTICVRAYGDGYKWSEIAKANKLVNPDLIYAGNKLTLPR